MRTLTARSATFRPHYAWKCAHLGAVLLVLFLGLLSVTGLSSQAQAYGICSMCMGRQDCIKTCEEKVPEGRKPEPTYVPDPWKPKQTAPVPAGLSQKNVETGDYCNYTVRQRAGFHWGSAKTGSFANAYGGLTCCCHGGVDPVTVLFTGNGQSCYCPTKSGASTMKCLKNFMGSGVCDSCDKREMWSSAAQGWITDAAAPMLYCCEGCKDKPTLGKTEFIKGSGMSEPLCSCPNR